MPRKLTQEEFLERLKKVHGDKIVTRDVYINSQTKLRFYCRVCKHTWEANPSNIMYGQGCPKCNGGIRYTQKDFLSMLEKSQGDNITTIDTYVNSSTKLSFHCNVCGNTWKAVPQTVLRGCKCPRCVGKGHKTQLQFLEDLNKTHGNKVTTNDKYINDKSKMKFKCGVCGTTWKATPNSILGGSGCPKCVGKDKKTQTQFLRDLKQVHGDTISTQDVYINNSTKIMFCCNICGNTWRVAPNTILSGVGCPNCASSSGEQTVRAVLEFNNINYDPQHNFKIRDRIHRLDFVLKDKNNNWCVIQPDGQQHFKKNNKFYRGTELDRDENKYLPAVGVRVLRIPWFWFDLDNTFILLQDFLGYDLKKPDRDYIPMYKKVKEMVYDYLKTGDRKQISLKYKVSISTLSRMFKGYFGMSYTKYIKAHPEYKIKKRAHNATKVLSIDDDGIVSRYTSQREASHQTGIGENSINVCLRGRTKTAGGLYWQYV